MWLASRVAVAVLAAAAPIRPLAWEPPYAVGVALENTKRQKKKEKEKDRNTIKFKRWIKAKFISHCSLAASVILFFYHKIYPCKVYCSILLFFSE